MDWLEKMNAALEYIEKHLDGEISYDQAAQIACCSTFYFQRLFSYVVGVSLSEYIRRRRMTQAAFELQRTKQKVMDIALKYGYTSPTSFHRAFQSVHGMTPTMARQSDCLLNAYPAIHFTVQVTGGQAISYRIEDRGAMRVVGYQYPISDNMEENHQLVPHIWKEFFHTDNYHKLSQLNHCEPYRLLGITMYQPQHIYYMIAIESVDDIPDDMCEYEIPAHTWVTFENNGDFQEDVQSVFKRFITEWLPFSGYEFAGLPDIEVYPIQEKISSKGHSEVMIAIDKIKER